MHPEKLRRFPAIKTRFRWQNEINSNENNVQYLNYVSILPQNSATASEGFFAGNRAKMVVIVLRCCSVCRGQVFVHGADSERVTIAVGFQGQKQGAGGIQRSQAGDAAFHRGPAYLRPFPLDALILADRIY